MATLERLIQLIVVRCPHSIPTLNDSISFIFDIAIQALNP